jgi:hypothetical protein
MKFVLFVEGHTEKKALPDFLRAWLAPPRLPERVGLQVVRFEGWAEYDKDIAGKVNRHLSAKGSEDIIAAIGLLDLYGPAFYPTDKITATARYEWAKNHIEERVKHERFRQHFAIYETEAWLLADPKIFPREVQGAFPPKCVQPETVNRDEPPAKLLERLYQARLKRRYQKVIDGYKLFRALPHEAARAKCPSLKRLLDDMLELAERALR